MFRHTCESSRCAQVRLSLGPEGPDSARASIALNSRQPVALEPNIMVNLSAFANEFFRVAKRNAELVALCTTSLYPQRAEDVLGEMPQALPRIQEEPPIGGDLKARQ